MWGKCARNQNKTKKHHLTSVKVLYELLTSLGTDVTNLIFPKDDVVRVYWKHSEDNKTAWLNVNVAVVAYVTTQPRLNIYEYLSELGGLFLM